MTNRVITRVLALSLLLAAAAFAQTTTTVTDTLTDPTGGHPAGTCSFQSARRFVSGNGWNVIGLPRVVSFTAGAISVALVPTDGAVSGGTLFYQKTCRAPLQTPGGTNCEGNAGLIAGGTCTVGPFTWGPTYFQVPVSSAPVSLANIESDALPQPIYAQWRGKYSPTKTYRQGDMVYCDEDMTCGSGAVPLRVPGTYISEAYANTGNTPPDSPSWWTLIVPRSASDYTGIFLPAVSGSGALKLASGAPQLVGGSAANCVHVDGSSGPCIDTVGKPAGEYSLCVDGAGATTVVPVGTCVAGIIRYLSMSNSQYLALTNSQYLTMGN